MGNLSRGARAYIIGVIVAGILLSVWWFSRIRVAEVWLLVVACVLASLLQFLSVFGSTARSSYSLSWIVYGFSLIAMGPRAALIVIMVAHIVEWMLAQERLKSFVQLFNMGTFAIAVSLAHLILQLGMRLFGSEPVGILLATLASLSAFTLVNHLMVGWVIKLARGQSLAESGVLGRFTLTLDFTLLCLGLVADVMWETNPVSLVLVAFVAFFLYQALAIPALERKAETDAKTNLFNAGYFNRALERERARAARFNRPLSVVMADLDLLRNINNLYGHLAGDVVLQGVAHLLQEAAGEYDVVSRFGGEEFAILMPEATAEEAMARAATLREAIAAAEFAVSTSVEPIRATMSFGVVTVDDDRWTSEQLIHNADTALYHAKRSGRNCVRFFAGANDQASSNAAQEMATAKEATGATGVGQAHRDNGHEASPAAERDMAARKPDTAKGDVKTARLPEPHYPRWAPTALIVSLLVTSALFGFFTMRSAMPITDWSGLLLFAVLAMLVEYLAVEIYVRETTVSTSAALLICGTLLFGPLGAIVLGPIIALASFYKHNQRLRALIFNSGNHVFAGLLAAGLFRVAAPLLLEETLPGLLVVGALAGGAVFVSTTYLLTAIIIVSSGGNFLDVWRERFRWLAFYYLVLGLVAAGLVFSYRTAGISGIVVVVAPLFMLRYSQKQYLDHTTKMVTQLRGANNDLLQQANEITRLSEDLLLTLARSVDLRDPYVMEHSKNVVRYALYIAEEMKLPGEQLELVRKAGLLHDIGKLGVAEQILFKPSRLSVEEYEVVKRHADIGAELIQGCHSLHALIPIVRHHHERYDGSGYPDSLAGEEIPLEARILCLADAVEAMASDRPYRLAMSVEEIVDEVLQCAGTQFDPQIVQAFVRVARKKGNAFIVNSAREAFRRGAPGMPIYLSHV